MALDDPKNTNPEDAEDSDSGSTSGSSGEIEFVDFLASEQNLRDDLLPFDEKRRLLAVHQDEHKLRVKKQKELRDQRKALKEGKLSLADYRNGQNAGRNAQYKVNPILANKVQFSGIDNQITPDPSNNNANTNEADKNELTEEYRYRYQPTYTPQFNPKPQFNK